MTDKFPRLSIIERGKALVVRKRAASKTASKNLAPNQTFIRALKTILKFLPFHFFSWLFRPTWGLNVFHSCVSIFRCEILNFHTFADFRFFLCLLLAERFTSVCRFEITARFCLLQIFLLLGSEIKSAFIEFLDFFTTHLIFFR